MTKFTLSKEINEHVEEIKRTIEEDAKTRTLLHGAFTCLCILALGVFLLLVLISPPQGEYETVKGYLTLIILAFNGIGLALASMYWGKESLKLKAVRKLKRIQTINLKTNTFELKPYGLKFKCKTVEVRQSFLKLNQLELVTFKRKSEKYTFVVIHHKKEEHSCLFALEEKNVFTFKKECIYNGITLTVNEY